ncbi:alpha/beta-hydrolase [Auricularia subglabra TFB-10046 SS5]|uniref:Alpha/beta-hydrolase n=1 Tax=Auricularia subglabra (strain TFB-10046 / SS5) TaxID=717982 RepID=J0LF40_AURST|nr:alpha/beta-hydrolase [Auricularia subglabra TFB-10046 SS5]
MPHCASTFAVVSPRQAAADPLSFDWYALKAEDDIKWTPCFDVQLCARLNLPLDHAQPSGPTTQIALQMIPATDKANYQGTIIVNPGGPGGAGTLLMFTDGAKLAQLFGPTFDILGFDPRGMGATTPLALCFSSGTAANTWNAQIPGILSPDDGSFQYDRGRAQLLRELCKQQLGGNGLEDAGTNATEWGTGRFMGTPYVAMDMIRIAEKLGQDKVHYYGISYGTIIGQYLAALHPDKIARMIIDGVSDGDHWLNGRSYDLIKDSGKVIDQFYQNCVDAGPAKCAVWENTPGEVAARMDRVLDELKAQPVAVPQAVVGPFVLTESVFLGLVFSDLYHPLTGFPDIAELARAVETQNQTRLSQIVYVSDDVSGLPPWFQPNQAVYAVECSDFPPLADSVADELAALNAANALVPRLGSFGASAVSRVRLSCADWPVSQKGRYAGPLAGALPVPVLVASARYDPITPLDAARNVTARYPGMQLLVQDSAGHATFPSMSNCTAAAMRAYMTKGELPPEGTVCEQDSIPLVDLPEPVSVVDARLRFTRHLTHLT